ncbi:MAG: class I adenylate-forming enzyme family protein [Chthoniobacterales bacterium]
MSKTSAQLSRKRRSLQAAEHDDALLTAWSKTLRRSSARAAIFDVRGNVVRTFADIEADAAEFMRELGSFAAGEVIAFQIGNHPDWPSLFVACLRKRLVVLPLEQTIAEEQRRAIFATCRVAAVASITASSGAQSRHPVTFDTVGAAAVLGGRRVRVERSCRRGRTAAPTGPEASAATTAPPWADKQPSLLKLTSGTTAAPRAIRFRSEQLLADCENICDTMGITPSDVNFGVVPISHSYGFSNLLTPILVRGVALALSSDRMPRAILDGIAATRATVFAGMPVFYQSLCDLPEKLPLSALRLCISAGAPLSVELARSFEAKSGLAIHSFYGSSECGGICYTRTPRPIPGFVGKPMCRVQVEFMDNGAASSAGHSGAIAVRSTAVADGYFPEADEAKLGDGVFRPDDLLEKIADGYRIVGRVSDVINVAGKKVSPSQVEAELLRCAGVREAVVFGRESSRRNEEVAACVVANGVTEAELLAHCRARLSSWQMPRRIFFRDGIPVNERGKISRRELARLYAADV